jgi:hypothetical protein
LVRATTTATISPAKATWSTATAEWCGAFWSGVIGQAQGRLACESARSAPVYTATTPGDAVAAEVSTEVIRACA